MVTFYSKNLGDPKALKERDLKAYLIYCMIKPIFEAPRMIKESESHDEKVQTLEKPVSGEVWEYLEEQIEQLVNSKVRTLKTLIIPNKKEPEWSISNSGARDGLLLEPLKALLHVVKSEKY